MKYIDEPRLPQWIRDAYETLEAEYSSETTELSRTNAQDALLANDGNIEEDAVYVIDRLLDRGWLYEVDGQLRKTD